MNGAIKTVQIQPLMNEKKHVVITGASQGLGRAMVEEFITRGFCVSACARNAKAMEELKQQYGEAHHFDVVDLASAPAVSNWCVKVLKTTTPDLVINNAAIINRNAPLWEVPVADFEALMDINITGVFLVLKHLLPEMIKAGEGVVVNMSSGWGRSVSPDVASYCGSKWAIEGMTKALATDLPSGITAVPLNPGVINTAMLQSCFAEAASSYDDATTWAKRAVPFILDISASDNGESLTVPD